MSIHKIIVHHNGAKAHTPSNSWKEAAAAAKWPRYTNSLRFLPNDTGDPNIDSIHDELNNKLAKLNSEHLNYIECQWDTEDYFPRYAKHPNKYQNEKIIIQKEDFGQIASHEGPWTEKAVKTIIEHYSKLLQLFSDPKTHAEQMLFNNGYFAGEEYADIRWDMMCHANTPKSVTEKLAHTTLYANSEKAINSLHPAIKKIQGGVLIDTEAKINAQNLEEMSGDIRLLENASLTAPNLREVESIQLEKNASLTAPNLREVKSIQLEENARLTAPNLREVKNIILKNNASLTAPNLEKTESIDLLGENASLTAPNLEKTESINLRASLTAPNLKKAEYIRLEENASLTAPNLKKVESIWLEENISLTIPDPGEINITYATRDKNNNNMKYRHFKSLNEMEPKLPSPADKIVSEKTEDPEPETPEPTMSI
jgi:hypothetical protein